MIAGALFCYGVNNDVPGRAQNRIGQTALTALPGGQRSHQIFASRLGATDPLQIDDAAAEARVQAFLLGERPPTLAEVAELLLAG